MNTFTSRLIVSVACASQWILYIYLHVVFSLLSTWISIHLLESVVHLVRPWKGVSLHHGNYSVIKPTVRSFSPIKFTSAYFLRMYLTVDFATPDTVAFFGWIFFSVLQLKDDLFHLHGELRIFSVHSQIFQMQGLHLKSTPGLSSA